MNPFSQIAATLTAERHTAARSMTAIMREHMRRHGPCTAAELGCQVGLSATRASGALCRDIKTGRVEVDRRQWPHIYSLADNPPLPPSLQRSIELLKGRGYTVIEP
jgi:hypothetical protein